MRDLHVTRWGNSGPAAVLVHGSGGWGENTWREQRPLADDYRLLLPDRRGHGRSPPTDRPDFTVDAADIARVLDDEPAHLGGHSYGGVVALLAAATVPDRVLSLTVIEPPALGLVRGDPAVEVFISALASVYGTTRDPEEAVRRFLDAFGFPAPARLTLTDVARAAALVDNNERPPWEAEIPLDDLSVAPFPKAVVRGDWSTAPERARARGGAALHAVCDVLERSLGALAIRVPGATHAPQLLGAPFNERLRAFWSGAGA